MYNYFGDPEKRGQAQFPWGRCFDCPHMRADNKPGCWVSEREHRGQFSGGTVFTLDSNCCPAGAPVPPVQQKAATSDRDRDITSVDHTGVWRHSTAVRYGIHAPYGACEVGRGIVLVRSASYKVPPRRR